MMDRNAIAGLCRPSGPPMQLLPGENPGLTAGAITCRPSGPADDAAAICISRRDLFGQMAMGIGAAALGSLLSADSPGAETSAAASSGGLAGFPNFAPKAKRVIFLFQSGAPSQMDLFDYKPQLADLRGTE